MTGNLKSTSSEFQTENIRKTSDITNIRGFLLIFLFLTISTASPTLAAPTTTLTMSVIENNTTVEEHVLDYQWMEKNLPVIGDGITHYYHQGPVFQGDPWNPNETVNLRDMGAIKGTSVRDICNISGGLREGDEVMIKAADGYHIQFSADFIENPGTRAGPLTIAWYNGAETGAGEHQGTGYVSDYFMGMRLVFCAPENPDTGKHVYGNADMNVTLPAQAQYFYSGLYPSTSGLSPKWVNEVRIYRGGFTGDRSAPIKDTPTPTPTRMAGLSLIPLVLTIVISLGIWSNRRKQ
jgi:hypothetical protein